MRWFAIFTKPGDENIHGAFTKIVFGNDEKDALHAAGDLIINEKMWGCDEPVQISVFPVDSLNLHDGAKFIAARNKKREKYKLDRDSLREQLLTQYPNFQDEITQIFDIADKYNVRNR